MKSLLVKTLEPLGKMVGLFAQSANLWVVRSISDIQTGHGSIQANRHQPLVRVWKNHFSITQKVPDRPTAGSVA
jgi:hypothetical protein